MIAWKTSLVRDRDGAVIGNLISGLDVTERKGSKRQVQLLNEALQAADGDEGWWLLGKSETRWTPWSRT